MAMRWIQTIEMLPQRILVGIVFVVSITAALTFYVALPPSLRLQEFSDYQNFYEPVARNILAGKGIVTNDGNPATGNGPGHTIVLAAVLGIGHVLHIAEDTVSLIFRLLCMGSTAVFCFLIASLFWRPILSLLATLICITYPFNLWFIQQSASEHTFMVFFYGAMYLFWLTTTKNKPVQYYVLCGLLFGLAALVRPIGLGITLVLAVFIQIILLHRVPLLTRLSRAGVLVLTTILVISPWIIWVYSRTGVVTPISSSGIASVRGGLTWAFITDNYPTDTLSPDVVALQQKILDLYPQSMNEIVSILANEFRENPHAVAELLILKIARSWYGTYSGQHETIAIGIQLVYLLLSVLGILGTIRQHDFYRQLTAAHILLVLYFWAMSSVVVANLRYLAPAMPLLLVLTPGIFILLKPRLEIAVTATSSRYGIEPVGL